MQKPTRHLLSLGLAATMALGPAFSAPTMVFAATEEELTLQIEQCSLEYKDAQAKVDELSGLMADNESRIAEIEGTLPGQREKTASSIRSLYKFQQSGGTLLDLVLSAEDFNEFLSMVQYLDIIQSHNMDEINRLVEMQDELSILNSTLDAQRTEAENERDRAQQALADAEEAREEARQAAITKALEEAKEREEALQQAAAHTGENFQTASGRTAPVETYITPSTDNGVSGDSSSDSNPTPSPTPSPAPSTDSRERFISTWAARIDSFNEGYPLGGYGRVFAEAAYDYGVDPRWSPAIARLESSSGLYCFESHNAWGWGDSAWGDWDTAIRSHMRGLAAGYGYSLTWDAALSYCPPPNSDFWYTTVANYMNEIWPNDSI